MLFEWRHLPDLPCMVQFIPRYIKQNGGHMVKMFDINDLTPPVLFEGAFECKILRRGAARASESARPFASG